MFKMDFTRTLKSIPVCAAKTASSFLSGTKRHSGLLGGRTSECKSSWTVKCLDVELPEDKTSLVSTFDELWSVCASDPLLMTGGEVGDMEGQALLAGGGRGGGGGGVDESCPSSSEELSSVRSMTSTFLLLPPPLLSLLAWLDEEEPCWSAPADVRHEPGEQHVSFMTWWCKKEKKNRTLLKTMRLIKSTLCSLWLNGRHSVCCWAERQFARCRLGRSLIKLELSTDETQMGGVAHLFNANWVTQASSGETSPCLPSCLVSPSSPLLYDAVETCCTSFLDLMGAQLPSSLNWISSQSMQLLRISTKSLQINTHTHTHAILKHIQENAHTRKGVFWRAAVHYSLITLDTSKYQQHCDGKVFSIY